MNDTRDLPPSRKLVYRILQDSGPTTKTELIQEAALGKRTVDRAINDLRQADLITATTDPDDRRRTLYETRKVSE